MKVYTEAQFKKWGSKGGKKRMASLSKEERTALSKKALKGRKKAKKLSTGAILTSNPLDVV